MAHSSYHRLPLFIICFAAVASAVSGSGSGSGRQSPAAGGTCGRGCRCSQNATIANCSYANLDDVPVFPPTTRILVLDWNRIEVLNSSLADVGRSVGLNQTSPLELISVAHNNLTDVAASTFRDLPGLRQLRLNDNNIRQLPDALFADASNIELLSVANNPLDVAAVEAAFAKHPPRLLRSLDITRTSVVTGTEVRLPETIFGVLPALEQLAMRQTNFENLTAEFFSTLTGGGLRKLDLSRSSLRVVDVAAFEPLAASLRELVLDDVIVQTRQLENLLTGLGGNGSELETLSLRNVFVYADHASAVHHQLFRPIVSTRLKTLRMDGNNVGLHGKIPEKLFHPLRHLVLLTLTNCDIKSIPAEAFKGLHHLQTLDLRHNALSCARPSDCGFMTSSQAVLSRLHTLDLADNLLATGADDSISFRFDDSVFPELADLDLSRNRMTSLVAGSFGQLRRLVRLRLNENALLENVDFGTFSGLPNLSRLEMNGCRRLTHLRQGALSGLSKLRVLSVQDSGLVHIHHSVLTHLDHLEEIYLRGNQLGQQGTSIEKLTTSHGRLKMVDLGSNRLPAMPLGLLAHQTSLHMIYLDDNRLFNCSQLNVLQSSTKLEFLDISGNVFTELEASCFQGLPAGASLHMADNPLHCSCGTVDAVSWLTASSSVRPTVSDSHAVMCSSPAVLAGVNPFQPSQSSAGSLLPGVWQCRWKHSLVISILVILVIVLLALSVCIVRRLLRRRACCSGSSNGGGLGGLGSPSTVSCSSVTISNSCYGNGATGTASGGSSLQGGGPSESHAHYRPLVEDESCVVSATQNGARSKPRQTRTMAGRVSGSGNFSSTSPVKLQQSSLGLAGLSGVTDGERPLAATGNGTKKSTRGGGNVDNKALLDCTVTDVEDSL